MSWAMTCVADNMQIEDPCEYRQADRARSPGRLLPEFFVIQVLCTILVASGILHLCLVGIPGIAWEGPVSPRKPGLFGISAGLTGWSILWVLTQLNPRRHDRGFALLMLTCLFLEVGLITLQYWRGVPSHFNRTTVEDAVIESFMLGLVALVTGGIAWLCVRAHARLSMSPAQVTALRAGLWFLLTACGIGFLITVVGAANLADGRSPEVWGRAGVLKYPHGAVLHAIQTLPLLAFLLEYWQIPRAVMLVWSAIAAHAVFLVHAVWQTGAGRSRLDVDAIGAFLLVTAAILFLWPVAALVRSVLRVRCPSGHRKRTFSTGSPDRMSPCPD